MKNGCLLLFVSLISCLFGQSVRDGIYTSQQAERGKIGYGKACASCHGENLEGQGQTPPLTGSDFIGNWDGMTVGALFDKIQDSMPAQNPGILTKGENADIIAYMLQVNKFPAGNRELPASSDALKKFRIEAAK